MLTAKSMTELVEVLKIEADYWWRVSDGKGRALITGAEHHM